MTQWLLANFTGADGTPLGSYVNDTGGTWSGLAITHFQIQSNYLRSVNGSGAQAYASETPAGSDYTVTSTFIVEAATGTDIEWMVDCDGTGNGYLLRWIQGTGWQLFRATPGFALIRSTVVADYATGSRILTIQVKTSGASRIITWFIDGIQVDTLTDATPPSTGRRLGLRAGSIADATTGSVYDNLSAVDGIVNPVPPTPATSYALTGPTSGVRLVASTAFTITPNGVFTGTITPNDGGNGGTFTPSSLSWSGDGAAKTFTYTPASAGTKTIAATNNSTLTNPAALSYLSVLPTQLIFDGNSLTFFDIYPGDVRTQLGSLWTSQNFGVSGQTTPQMSADAAAQIDVLYSTVNYSNNILVAWEITNDIYVNDPTAQVAYQNFVDYCNARRAVGWKVIAISVTPRTNSGTPADFETKRQAVNVLLRANWKSFADAFADVSNDSRLTDSTNVTYYSDLVHMTNAGYQIVADYVCAVILSLVSPGGASGAGGASIFGPGIFQLVQIG